MSTQTTRSIKLTFPLPVRQLAPNIIEIVLETQDFPVFSEQAINAVHETMGTNRGEILLDDVANDLLRRQILDGVR
jgi:hypothetical protein